MKEQPSPAPVALKACPRGHADVGVLEAAMGWWVFCRADNCPWEVTEYNTEAEAIAAWNTRAEPAGVRELVAKMRERAEIWGRVSKATGEMCADFHQTECAQELDELADRLAALLGPQEMTDEAK